MDKKLLLSAPAIERRVAELGRELSDFYRGKPLTVVAVLNGGMFFAVDLARHLDIPVWIDSLAASSYVNDKSSGEISFRCFPKLPMSGRHILLVDDVLDTGFTMRKLFSALLDRGALSVRCCVLLDKEARRHPEGLAKPDWKAFSAPDRYLVGMGLDSEENFRNLCEILAVTDSREKSDL